MCRKIRLVVDQEVKKIGAVVVVKVAGLISFGRRDAVVSFR